MELLFSARSRSQTGGSSEGCSRGAAWAAWEQRPLDRVLPPGAGWWEVQRALKGAQELSAGPWPGGLQAEAELVLAGRLPGVGSTPGGLGEPQGAGTGPEGWPQLQSSSVPGAAVQTAVQVPDP